MVLTIIELQWKKNTLSYILYALVQKRKLFHTVMCSSKLTKNLNFYLDSKTFPIVLFQIFLGIADSFDGIGMIG